MKVKELLAAKGRPVVTIGPNDSIRLAIGRLVENNIGALPVCDSGGIIVGILTERDILQECSRIKTSSDLDSTRVKDVMSRDVVIGVPEDDLDYAVSIMAQKGIRHLPILDGSRLAGMVSMRDVVELQLEESKAQVRYLADYIAGGYI